MFNQREKIDQLDKTHDEETIVKLVQAMVSEAEAAMEEWLTRTKIAYQLYLGNHWLDESGEVDKNVPSYRFRTTRDLIFQTIETQRPLLTDSRPRIIITADFPDVDGDLAVVFTDILEAEHERRNEELLLSSTIADALICGKGYRKYTWDSQRDRTLSTILQPWDVLLDPYGTLTDFSDCKYVIHKKEMDAEDVARIYDVSVDDIVEGSGEIQATGLFSKISRKFRGGSSIPQHRPMGRFRQASIDEYIRQRVKVYECWFFGQMPVELENEGEAKSVKYPHGRVLVVCGNKLLWEDENPYWHGRVPIVTFNDYITSGDFLGFGEVHHLKDAQKDLDVLLSQIITNIILMANAQWVYEEGAVPQGWLTNQPGLNIEVPRGMLDRIRKEVGAPMPSYVHQMALDIERHAERITSVNEVTQGRQPVGQTSGVAISGLQRAAYTRIRQKARLLEDSYRQCGEIEVSNFQQFANFVDPRITREHQMGEWLRWEERMRNLLYDIKIESQSELPHNLEGKLEFAFAMLDRGIFDVQEFLKFTGIPVSDRLRQKHETNGRSSGIEFPLGAPQQPTKSVSQQQLIGIGNLGQGVPEGVRLP